MNAIAEPEEVSTLTEPDDSWATVVATVSRIETSLNLWLSQSHGLGLTDYRALALLSEAPDRELRISELAIRIGLNQSSTTRLVGRLELKGTSLATHAPTTAAESTQSSPRPASTSRMS